MIYHSDPGDLNSHSGSVTKFFSGMLETSDAPTVDWSESSSVEVLARETIDLSALHNGPAESEQIFGRLSGSFVLFKRERNPDGEILTKTVFPGRFSRDFALIQRHRPAPVPTYALVLQAEDFDGIMEAQSKQTRSGRWKNSTSRGTPTGIYVESRERSKLEALRTALLGDQASGRMRAEEVRQEALQQKLAALSPEQQRAAMIQAALQQMQETQLGQPAALEGLFDPRSAPLQAVQLHEMMQARLREIEQRAKQTLAQNPVNPEALRLIDEMMKRKPQDNDPQGA